jgi:iron complex outermembrane recepter protein
MNQFQQGLFVTGVLSLLVTSAAGATPGLAEGKGLESHDRPATTVKEWVAQMEKRSGQRGVGSGAGVAQSPDLLSTPDSFIQVTGVSLNPTETGLEIVLQTAEGKLLQIDSTRFRSEGDSLIADIPNAVLTLPEGAEFVVENPTADITQVRVVQQNVSNIQVRVTGNNTLPDSEVVLITGELAYSLNSEVEEPDEEIVVTGEQGGYRVPNATTATRTDTPLRDIPQSIQVIPQQVLEEQQVIQLRDAVRNVSGVIEGSNFGNSGDAFLIRGFLSNNILLDGIELGTFNLSTNSSFRETANIDRIEVLKGPASVLYGTLEPGGIINVVTKQPLDSPFYQVELQAGNFELFRPSIDLSGPLNSERTLLYRFNAVYQNADDFRDFDQGIERVFVAPVLRWVIGDNTNLTVNFEYLYDERPFDRGLTALGDEIADIPYDRILGEPDDINIREQYVASYRLEHRFNENWQIRNVFRYISTQRKTEAFQNRGNLNEVTGDLARSVDDQSGIIQGYALQTNLIGEFSTGSIEHTLLFGVDLARETNEFDNRSAPNRSIINIFNPIYGAPRPRREDLLNNRVLFGSTVRNLGLYLQDQIALADNLQLLVGGRFDVVDQDSFFTSISAGDISDTTDEQQNEAFSPRIGIVYQPIEPLSIYASFSRSFAPNSGTTAEGDILEPTRGTQYEIGIRGEFLERRLTANLAAYYLTKSNVAATDPNDPDFSVATGEQRSQGIELDVIGRILPGWNIIASYAYTDAEITEDEGSLLEGNRLAGVPEHAASLWSTYEIQSGSLRGLGFGVGLFFVGDREDFDNSFEVPSYLRTDASIFYRRNNWRTALNFRNLFDIDYIEAVETRSRITPGAPFTVIGSVSVEF